MTAPGAPSPAELVAAWGSPLWLYDLAEFERRAAELFALLPAGARLLYSLKANPLPAIVEQAWRCGCGAEVSSPGELRVALAAGFDGAGILYTGPAKTCQEIAAAIAAGVTHFSVESWLELERLAAAAQAARIEANVVLRINPSTETRARLSMSGADSQFGFLEAEAATGRERLCRLAPQLRLLGFHIYHGTQMSSAEALAASFENGFAVAERLAGQLGLVPGVLNLGGGFPWAYANGDPAPDLGGLAPALASLAGQRRLSAKAALWFESGRYLSASCGTLLATVVDVKKTASGKRQIVLDTGIHHLGGMSGLGRIPRARLWFDLAATAARGTADAAATRTPAVVVGPLCTPLDCLARDAELPALAAGDVVSVRNSGAYGLTASLFGFLSRSPPVELAHRGGDIVAAYRLQSGHAPAHPQSGSDLAPAAPRIEEANHERSVRTP